jgi:hypothetical protein
MKKFRPNWQMILKGYVGGHFLKHDELLKSLWDIVPTIHN